MRTHLPALVLLAGLGCGKTPAPDRAASAAVDASPLDTPSLPTSRSGILARYVDASTLDTLSNILGSVGLSPCMQAFGTGTSGGPPPTPADRASYLGACERLPLPVQKCLSMLYAGAHPVECAGVVRGLDPETRAELDRLERLRPTTR